MKYIKEYKDIDFEDFDYEEEDNGFINFNDIKSGTYLTPIKTAYMMDGKIMVYGDKKYKVDSVRHDDKTVYMHTEVEPNGEHIFGEGSIVKWFKVIL